MELIKREDSIDAMAELQGMAQSKAELTGISKAWKRIKALPTASSWHRVEDGLPRGQELVIVAVKDTAGDTPFWYTQCGWITTDGEYWIVDNEICDYVVAWMPLPEPPKEGNNGSSRKEASSDL